MQYLLITPCEFARLGSKVAYQRAETAPYSSLAVGTALQAHLLRHLIFTDLSPVVLVAAPKRLVNSSKFQPRHRLLPKRRTS